MASDTATEIHILGPGSWTIDGVNVGNVLGGSVKAPFSLVEGKTGKAGNASVTDFYIPESPMIEIEYAQDNLAIYAASIEGATRATSGANEVLGFGKTAGYRVTPKEIIYVPEASEITTSRGFKAWKCVPVGEPEFIMKAEQQVLKATFKVQFDDTKTNGEKFMRWGNVSVSADTSAPTVSSITPADGATGQSTAVAPAITFDAALDESTVTGSNGAANAFIIAATETGVTVPIAATVTYNSSTFVVTITPTSALSGATTYEIVLTTGIKDASGNRFAGAKYSFATT